MAILVDITPLRDLPQFRRLFFGQALSFVGSQMTAVAVPFQVFRETDSSLAVGLVGVTPFLPLVAGALLAGSVVDAFDRRRILQITSVLLAVCSVGLALDALGGSSLIALFGLSAISAGIASVDYPARAASLPRLVPGHLLPQANALNQMQQSLGFVVGPALAGVLLAGLGATTVFVIDAVSFAAVFLAATFMHPLPVEGGGTPVGLASIVEGLRFLRRARLLVSTFVIDIGAMVFGMPRALFPELGERVYGGGPRTVGLLYAAPGAGALVGALVSGWVGRVQRQGRAILFAVTGWGVAVAAAGAVPWLPLALFLFAVAGAADMVSAVYRNSIAQTVVPDHLRGRLAAIFIAVVAGGPRVGDIEAGGAAALLGARGSVITGGLLCLVCVVLVWRIWPELDSYRPSLEPNAGTDLGSDAIDTGADRSPRSARPSAVEDGSAPDG